EELHVKMPRFDKQDLVIEIGPGLGAMTVGLAAAAGFVAAVELDRQLMPVLKSNLKDFSNTMILNKDILKVDIQKEIIESPELEKAGFEPKSVKVVANLPYYITTPIIMGLLEQRVEADTMVFMVQKEVAVRMAAAPGGKEYGALSVAVQYYSAARKVFDVPPECFIPRPEVDSSVIRMDVYKTPPVNANSRENFFRTVKAAFGQRRKTLVNALFNSGYFNINKDELKEILSELGISENARGETLSLEQFAELSNRLYGPIV
ncbi:MAG: 16S rRNA (adenine(1518)-N(6)/adenine(1519)-N(6))-dimethyltransferase RsmA, partial [Clostridiales bacterium]|nr:16S rRNA (adenine(1518)-N(6)/adenine(1519)-N(6))-dimethyltransferase RsmA [Clostridiales bacterium]